MAATARVSRTDADPWGAPLAPHAPSRPREARAGDLRSSRAGNPGAARADEARAARRAEARRRLRLIKRRRLDLLQDGAIALVLAIFLLVVTAGLGVVALLAIPTALFLLGSVVVERRRRRQRWT